jgi:hypothetical protein
MLVRQSWEVRASTDARCRTCDGVGLIYTPSTYAVDGRRLSIPSPCPRCGVLMACVTCTGDGACSFCRGTGLVDA